MLYNKKSYTLLASAFVAGALLIAPLSSMAQQVYHQITVKDVVEVMKQNDLQSKVVLEDDELANWRLVFTPRDGFTPPHSDKSSSWTAAYRLNVEPLRIEAKQAQEDYQLLAGELQREAASYGQVFNYWILNEQLKLSKENLALVKDELKNTKTRFEQGVASKHDLLQVEISLNSAQVSYDEAVKNMDKLTYAVNQKLGQNIAENMEITFSDFSFLHDEELNVPLVTKNILDGHPSLNQTKKELAAYRKGHEVVNAENFIPVNATLPIYLEREVAYWELRLKQQGQQLEMSGYSLMDDLKQLKSAVLLYEENVKQGKVVYDMAVKRFEQGTTTYVEVDQARVSLLNTNLQLSAAKKDYMAAKENFRLLKLGHIPQ